MSPLLQKAAATAAVSALFWIAILPATAAVALPRVVSSHRVRQENMPVPIWRTAAAGELVKVTFRDQTEHRIVGTFHVNADNDSFQRSQAKWIAAPQSRWWVADTVSWRKYRTERQTADVKVLPAGTGEIKCELTGAADPALDDLLLTLSTGVPKNRSACVVEQGAVTTTTPASNGVIRCDVLPGKDPVVIHPTAKS